MVNISAFGQHSVFEQYLKVGIVWNMHVFQYFKWIYFCEHLFSRDRKNRTSR